jgi:hydrogenase 3 maturation protease
VKSQSKRLEPFAPTRIALVGVGSELNGDDAAGIWVARKLKAAREVPAHFLAIDGGSLPENASGPLRRFKPDIVLLVDAADMGQPVGTIQWLLSEQIGGMSASSHTLPLPVLGQFLESEFGCTVEYLGIQPGQLEYTLPMSAEVEKAVAQIVRELKKQIIARGVPNG